MFRCFAMICFLLVPAANATVLYTDSGEVNNVLQFSSAVQLGLIDGTGSPQFWFGMSFVLPAGQYSSIGADAGLWQFGAGTTTLAIYDNLNNKPNNQLGAVTVNPPGGGGNSLTSALFSPSLVLTGGQTYYLIGETTAQQVTWLGSTTGASGTYYIHEIFPTQAIWTNSNSGALGAFDITGASTATPEPSAILETLIGLGLLISSRCRVARRNRGLRASPSHRKHPVA